MSSEHQVVGTKSGTSTFLPEPAVATEELDTEEPTIETRNRTGSGSITEQRPALANKLERVVSSWLLGRTWRNMLDQSRVNDAPDVALANPSASQAPPKMAEREPEPAEAEPVLAELMSRPSEAEPEPAEPASKPSEAQPKPAELASELAEFSATPSEVDSKPADQVFELVELMSKPSEAEPEPAEVAPEQAELMSEPSEEEPKPAELASELAEFSATPSEMDSKPADQAFELVELMSKPSEAEPEPAEVAPEQAELMSEPSEEEPKPAELASELAEFAVKPLEIDSKPADQAFELVELMSKPSEAEPEPAEVAPEQAELMSEPSEEEPEPANKLESVVSSWLLGRTWRNILDQSRVNDAPDVAPANPSASQAPPKMAEAEPVLAELMSKLSEVEPKLAAPMAKPAAPMPKPAEPLPESVAPMPKPAAPMPKPAAPMPKPAEPMPESVAPMPKPAEPMSKPAEPMPKPAEPMPKPAAPMPKPAAPMSKPAAPLPKPAAPMPKPVELAPMSAQDEVKPEPEEANELDAATPGNRPRRSRTVDASHAQIALPPPPPLPPSPAPSVSNSKSAAIEFRADEAPPHARFAEAAEVNDKLNSTERTVSAHTDSGLGPEDELAPQPKASDTSDDLGSFLGETWADAAVERPPGTRRRSSITDQNPELASKLENVLETMLIERERARSTPLAGPSAAVSAGSEVDGTKELSETNELYAATPGNRPRRSRTVDASHAQIALPPPPPLPSPPLLPPSPAPSVSNPILQQDRASATASRRQTSLPPMTTFELDKMKEGMAPLQETQSVSSKYKVGSREGESNSQAQGPHSHPMSVVQETEEVAESLADGDASAELLEEVEAAADMSRFYRAPRSFFQQAKPGAGSRAPLRESAVQQDLADKPETIPQPRRQLPASTSASASTEVKEEKAANEAEVSRERARSMPLAGPSAAVSAGSEVDGTEELSRKAATPGNRPRRARTVDASHAQIALPPPPPLPPLPSPLGAAAGGEGEVRRRSHSHSSMPSIQEDEDEAQERHEEGIPRSGHGRGIVAEASLPSRPSERFVQGRPYPGRRVGGPTEEDLKGAKSSKAEARQTAAALRAVKRASRASLLKALEEAQRGEAQSAEPSTEASQGEESCSTPVVDIRLVASLKRLARKLSWSRPQLSEMPERTLDEELDFSALTPRKLRRVPSKFRRSPSPSPSAEIVPTPMKLLSRRVSSKFIPSTQDNVTVVSLQRRKYNSVRASYYGKKARGKFVSTHWDQLKYDVVNSLSDQQEQNSVDMAE
ncbi:hypothetical protein CYMTET_13348 [Cymbomonas tetramitiformis]|uniref:Uncharacterized protein n=1 Tax=Cymbomonas tetramitiformis TaxID=36881 RepID=A0AAE0LBH7_9CHLO|nr:hypothetical protein CYMTET_13348 [Cymbomonas tetramitiformis]